LHDHDDIQDFLQKHDMVDAYSDFYDERPASFLNLMNPMTMHLHELSKTDLMLIARSTKSKPKQLSSARQTYNYRLKPKPNN
jgi:hypothetical protein